MREAKVDQFGVWKKWVDFDLVDMGRHFSEGENLLDTWDGEV